MPPVAFTTPFPLSRPLHRRARVALPRRGAPPLCARARMRAGGPADAAPGPDAVPLGGAGDDPLSGEDIGDEAQFGGGRKMDPVRPADFEDEDDVQPKGMAAPASKQDDLLAEIAQERIPDLEGAKKKEPVGEKVPDIADAVEDVIDEMTKMKEAVVEKAADAGKAAADKAAKAKEADVDKAADAGKAVVDKAASAKGSVEKAADAKKAADVGKPVVSKAASTKETRSDKVASPGKAVVDKAEGMKEPVVKKGEAATAKPATATSVKMSPEQIERAKAARTAAAKVAEEKAAQKKASTKDVLANAEKLLVKIGTKTGAFALGENARAKAEVFVEDTIKLGDSDQPSQADKVKASAASAAKAVVATITKGWEEKVVPQVKERLPEEYAGLSSKTFAAVAVGLFVSIALLPSLFSGGGQPVKETPAKKKLDAETAVLEKKLSRDRSLPSRPGAQRSVFPPEERVPVPPPKEPQIPKPVAPTAKVPEAKKGETVTEATKPATPPISTVTRPKPVETTPQAVKEITPPKPQPQAQPMKRADVTPAIVMSSITKALGTNAALVSSASFDSLTAEPTVVLEVSRAYHRLPAVEQKQIADKALKATRMLGYERVSFIEKDTGVEVAHAGIDIELEDEAENLRAELRAMHKQSEKLATMSANQEAQIDTLQARLDEERDEFAGKRVELEAQIKNMQKENAELVDDLAEAKEEISKIPDRLALEERTLEAENKSGKLIDTVEMLSKQLATARADESRAKQVEAESLAAVKEGERVKAEALASVAGQIQNTKADAERRATQNIAEAQNDARSLVEASKKRVQEIEDSFVASQKEATRVLEDTTKSYERRLADEEKAKTVEVKTIQGKYEAMLEDVQRKAKADLDAFQKQADKQMAAAMREAKATANSLMKERDQALKETAKAEAGNEKTIAKAVREKEGLQAKIERLEARLKGRDKPASEQAAEMKQETGAGT